MNGEGLSSGDDFDFASNTSAFVAIGYLRTIDPGKTEDSSRPYEICGADMRRESVCMFCEYRPVDACQMQIVPKNVHIVRSGVLGITPTPVEIKQPEKKKELAPAQPSELFKSCDAAMMAVAGSRTDNDRVWYFMMGVEYILNKCDPKPNERAILEKWHAEAKSRMPKSL